MRAAIRRWFASGLMVALVAASFGVDGPPAGASEDPTRLVITDVHPRDDQPHHPRLDSALAALEDRTRRGTATDRLGAANEVVDISIQVTSGRGAGVEARLRSLGATRVTRHGATVFATVRGGHLTALAGTDGVAWAQTALEPVPLAITGEGVGFIDADDWHAAGLTGTGVKVAIIDLGFQGYSTLLGKELPGSVTARHWGCGSVESNTVHGTGVAEIVHEVAPGAELYLLCVRNSNDLSSAVNYAIAEGVHVINHSVGWLNSGRGDGTGVIGDIVQTAHDAGILWVNAAGNHARLHWGGPFNDTSGDDLHNFAPDDRGISFWLPPSESFMAHMRWDDWPSSDNDYDLRLFAGSGSEATEVVLPACTTQVTWQCNTKREQTGTQWPTEAIYFTNSSPEGQWFHVAIHRADAVDSPPMDVFFSFSEGAFPPGVAQSIQHYTGPRSVIDPATSSLAMAVGAVGHSGGSAGLLHSYSSRGPTIDHRTKPDLVAPSAVKNSSYGTFAGTSAAAPHVAGAAALVAGACKSMPGSDLFHRLLDLAQPGKGTDPNLYGAGVLALGDPAAVTNKEWCSGAQSGEPADIEISFLDATGHEWEEAINWMGGTGLSSGCNPPANTRFCPDRLLNRGEMATFLRRMLSLASSQDNGPFIDHLTNTHRANINAIRIAKITLGCNPPHNTRYCPSGTLTRAEIATFLTRSFRISNTSQTYYTDIAGHWGVNPINAAAHVGLAWACPAGASLFCPNALVSRGEMAAWIHRAWHLGYLPQYGTP